jgi:type I restriction enzyme, S subunit
MPSSEITLGDVAELVRGVAYKPSDLLPAASAETTRLLRATNIGVSALALDDVLHVPKGLVRDAQYLLQHDIVIAMSSGSRAAVGRLAQLRISWVGTFGAFCGVIRPRLDKVDPLFLGYLVSSPEFRTRIDTYASGTAIMNLSRDHLLGFRFVPPTRSEQKAIGMLLGVLDDRIDNLRQTIVTLQDIGQALFKSWFVDFDPVRAKAEGREPEGIDPATAALFPGEFEDSELGPIPKGWGVARFDHEFDFTMGQSPPGSTYNSEKVGVAFFQGCTDFGTCSLENASIAHSRRDSRALAIC